MRQALGKGIGALIPSASARTTADTGSATRSQAPAEPSGGVREIPVAVISVNPRQPRDVFDEGSLGELAASIAQHGLLQPILVRALAADRFELIAGERRLRAAKLAGLASIPALVRDAREEQSLLLAIVENVQRADLSPLEEARAYRELADDFALTQEEIAGRVGKSRPAIANTLRLLTLPEEVQTDIAAGRLSAGHARALLALDSDSARVTLAREIARRRMSVRETETAVTKAKPRPAAGSSSDPDLRRLESDLSRALGTRVSIRARRGGVGTVEMTFYSDDDLARLADLLLAAGGQPLGRTAHP
jgi:ParB family transcriptional regulator, chromosome partitioning protein